MDLVKSDPKPSVTLTYVRYTSLFLILWLVIATLDWETSPQRSESLAYMMQGQLAEILNFSASVALIITGVIAAAMAVFKRTPHLLIWVGLGILHAWFLSTATSVAVGAGGNFVLAAHEQLLYGASGSVWTALWRQLILFVALPLLVAFCFSLLCRSIVKRKSFIDK